MITERQLSRRQLYLGASDIAAVLGVDPYRNAADVYAEKVYGVHQSTNDAMDLGNKLEPVIAEMAETRLGKLRAVGTERRIKDSPILAHVDRIVVADRNPVEIKSSGILNPFAANRDEWGEPESDQVPERVIVQTHVHMAATDRPVCHVPTLLGGRGFIMFKINFDEALWEHILSRSQLFWAEHVEVKQPPADLIPSMDTIRRIKRLPGKVIEADEKIIAAWADRVFADEAKKKAVATFEDRDAAFKALLGDAEAVTFPDGSQATYMLQKRKAYQVEEAEFRVLRHKKAKGQ